MNTYPRSNKTKLQEMDRYHGFRILKIRYIEELQADLYELIHEATQARVLYIGNGDQENLFSLSFQTIPKRSNGIAHILEHCVLCGSKKYPVRDPFFSMTRRSLHTYMNALTGADFTCYPAATQNERDFYNLLDVYLDAVFYPTLSELSFAQEGHRLDFEADREGSLPSLQMKGIVYNEMKGSLSNPISRLSEAISSALFPDTPYGINSGGEPKEIPSLTLEELKAFHKEHYTLSNCLFFFYGDIPLEKHLDYLEKNLFSTYKSKSVTKIAPIPLQPRFEAPRSTSISYPVDAIDVKNPSSYYAVSWLTTHISNQLECLALAILDSVLMDTDASPLKKALLATSLCRNASSSIDLEIQQIPYTIIFTGVEKENEKRIEMELINALQKIAQDGIPEQLIESAFHQIELDRSEIIGDGTPFGLVLYFRAALLAHHHSDPMWGLCVHTLLQELRNLMNQNRDYFSNLIEKYFLQNRHRISILMTPSLSLAAEEEEEEQKNLQKIEALLSKDTKEKISAFNATLEAFQEETGDLSVLPSIAVADISPEIQPIELKIDSFDIEQNRNIRLLSHAVFTNEISYVDIVIPLPYIEEENLWLVRIVAMLLPQIGTKDFTYIQLLEEMQSKTGGISASLNITHNALDATLFQPSLYLRGKALKSHTQNLFHLCKAILDYPRFEDTKRIRELIEKHYTSLKNGISSNSLRYATLSANKFIDKASKIEEAWHGISYFKHIEQLVSNYESEELHFLDKLKSIAKMILQQQSDIDIIVSAQKETIEQIITHRLWNLSNLAQNKNRWNSSSISLEEYDGKLHAFIVPQQTAFTVMAFPSISYSDGDAPYISIAAHLMENVILHKRIREQGGAYGAGSSLQSSKGLFYLYSYRDPNIAATIEAFHEAINRISSGDFNSEDLEEAKREIIQKLDAPIAPGSRGEVAYLWMQSERSDEMRQSYRKVLLSADCSSVQKAAHLHFREKNPTKHLITYTGKELFYREKERLLRQNIQFTEYPFS